MSGFGSATLDPAATEACACCAQIQQAIQTMSNGMSLNFVGFPWNISMEEPLCARVAQSRSISALIVTHSFRPTSGRHTLYDSPAEDTHSYQRCRLAPHQPVITG